MRSFKFFFLLSVGVILFFFVAKITLMAFFGAALLSGIYFIARKARAAFHRLEHEGESFLTEPFHGRFGKHRHHFFDQLSEKHRDNFTNYRNIEVL
ncbi:MAG: hypothetical protein ACPGJS_09540 [Flammeovirgaceae bacterium]